MPDLSNKIETQKLSKEQGFGFYLPQLDQKLHDGRYEVKRLLGLGTASSVFLCLDLQSVLFSYVAIKILTADATEGNSQNILQESDIMQAITELPENDPLPTLLDRFEVDGPHGRHICLVMHPLSTDLNTFRTTAPSMALPVHTVKVVIAEMLEGLKVLHQANIIHTDVKADNVLFRGPEVDVIDCELAERPAILETEIEVNGTKLPIMRPQPLPHEYKWDDPPFLVELYGMCLSDFSHAIWASKERKMPFVGSETLRAPEVILQAGYDFGVDIWAVGCTVFEMLTGRWMFKPDVEEGDPWTAEDDLLAKMMELTGETFDADMLSRSMRRDYFFDDKGNLKRIENLVPVKLEDALKNYGTISAEEAIEAAKFMAECMRLDPARRWTAEKLLQHPWMDRGPPPSCAGAKWG
ncbi:kinase-like protein [Dendrothele bispora CBS 962.96]|uniref:non-specific serine/threonine protein kinase n=1 Tax=Dendrothele bispora (strain CBS 962.96) TaxID=1314807 RepID=A0A4S8MWZ9_DENBC|nr:kinase-like protein [Dendrothele bispora CBS 962.96]